MTYKEYKIWCNDRACDGCCGMIEAMVCINILDKLKKMSFWKRKKEWENKYSAQVYEEIIKPTNQKIETFKSQQIS